MMRGVGALRRALGDDQVDVVIVSAGYGLIAEHRRIAPYDKDEWLHRDRWGSFAGVSLCPNGVAACKTYRDNPALVAVKVLDAVGMLVPRDECVEHD